ncbi:hypothetical protein F5Y16DRAFT_62955 [Xylariaceae sp. FL0255]|nr:hypothetical protein F5Y16DRAFT_62955 [Xylariaceae sp. FL0255]
MSSLRVSRPILVRLQGFKVSTTTILTLLQFDSDRRAEQLQVELAANVVALLYNNRELSRRMMHLETALDERTICNSLSKRSTASSLTTVGPKDRGRVTSLVSPIRREEQIPIIAPYLLPRHSTLDQIPGPYS